MKHTLMAAGLLALLVLAVCPLTVKAAEGEVNPFVVLEKVVRAASDGILANPKVKALKGGVMTVAPADIRMPGQAATDPDDKAMVEMITKAVQTKLATAFINGGGENLEVVDQVVVDKAMTKLNLDVKGLNDPDNWKPLADATGVKYILLGFFAASEDGAFSFDTRLVDLESKRAIAAAGGVGNVITGEIIPNGGAPAK